jgi:type VI secretion system protein VasI
MIRISITALAVLLAASPAKARDRQAIARCAAIKGDLDRLTCFDGLAKQAGLAGPQSLPVPTEGTGKWQVQRDKNPVDDSERVVLVLVADSGKNRRGMPIAFIARCQSSKTEVYIAWEDYLGMDGARVTTRVGDSPAKTETWSISTDRRGSFAPSAVKLLKDMATADKFLAQVVPYGESPITAIFDTAGLRTALAPLTKVCGWQP